MSATELSPDALVSLVEAYNPGANGDKIARAFAFACEMHAGQTRKSGEPYISHPLAVATYLAEQQLDDDTIITALLHDTVEDTRADSSTVKTMFGESVAEMVDGVTNLTALPLASLHDKQSANIRKMLEASSKNLRVVLVKLADRLHNMRTIKAMPPEKQITKARETMEFYAPLAGRLGMQKMREELEDLAFSVLDKESRTSIIKRFAKLAKDAEDVVNKIKNDIRTELDKHNIKAEVHGRAKRPYSIWRKMQEKEIEFSRLSDIYGFRIIVEDTAQCYQTLGIVHQRWKSVPGRFKDYISQPKKNGYRSLHTTVSGRDGKRVEMQIRTKEMHEAAQTGVAAHWAYRDGVRVQNPYSLAPQSWINELMQDTQRVADNKEFLEHVKLEMLTENVYCFTPKGQSVALPRGATLIDFAFRIHSRLGWQCVGGKVDGKEVPLSTRLRNGQSVEIIKADGQRPKKNWLNMCVTGTAKSNIRDAIRKDEREKSRDLGYDFAQAAFAKFGKPMSDKLLERAAQNLNFSSKDQLLEQIGGRKIASSAVVKSVHPDLALPETGNIKPSKSIVGLKKFSSYSHAPCCNPLPGERVCAIVEGANGENGKEGTPLVHRVDCARLADLEGEENLWIDVHWTEGHHQTAYKIGMETSLRNDAGVLGRVCTLIGQRLANIHDVIFLEQNSDFFKIHFVLEMRDSEQWQSLLLDLQTELDVQSVERVPCERDENKS